MCLKNELTPEQADHMPYECYGYVIGRLAKDEKVMPGVIGKGRYMLGKEYEAKFSTRDPWGAPGYFGFHGVNSITELINLYFPEERRVIILCSFREPMGIGYQTGIFVKDIPAFRYKYRTALKIIRISKQIGPQTWLGKKTWRWVKGDKL